MYTSRTIDSKAAYDAQVYLTNAKISFHELLKIKSEVAIKINKSSVFTDYMRALKRMYIKPLEQRIHRQSGQ